MYYESNIVNFFISSKQHSKAKPITNSWTASGIVLPINKLPIDQCKQGKGKQDHIKDIKLSEFSSTCEVRVLIGADMLRIHLQTR